MRPVEQGVGEGVARPPVGHTRPQEHPDLAGADGAAEGLEEGAASRLAGGVFGVRFLDSVAVRERLDGGVLERAPHARGELAGNAEHWRYGLRRAHGKADPRASHAVALAERVQLHRPFRAGERQETKRLARVEDARVGIVVDHENAPRLRPRDDGGEAVGVWRLARWHVGVVEPQQPNGMALRLRGGGEGLERSGLGVVAVGLGQGVGHGVAAGEAGGRGVRRVARVGHKGRIARIEVGEREEATGLFAAEQRDDALRRHLHAKVAAKVIGHGGRERRNAPVGLVAEGVLLPCPTAHGADDALGGRQVGAAHTEVDDVLPLGHAPADLRQLAREVVRRQAGGPSRYVDALAHASQVRSRP